EQRRGRSGARLAPADRLMQEDGLDDLTAVAVDGTERGHRLLEDARDLRATDRTHLLAVRIELREVDDRHRRSVARPPPEPDLALDDSARPIHDPQDRALRDALAAPALAVDADLLPR